MNQLELKKVIRPVILIVALMIAVYTIVHLWNYYNAAPWTRDGRVRGDVIQVSSDVAGLVTEVLVQDNQTVKKGQVLFKIDVSRRALDVETVAFSALGGSAFYGCRVGHDELGGIYLQGLNDAGIQTTPKSISEGVTGTCMVLISPDSERTMHTYLGITAELSQDQIDFEPLK
ncbi:PfkB family carbohydrate kinase, partial [Acinetobacter baumannii]